MNYRFVHVYHLFQMFVDPELMTYYINMPSKFISYSLAHFLLKLVNCPTLHALPSDVLTFAHHLCHIRALPFPTLTI